MKDRGRISVLHVQGSLLREGEEESEQTELLCEEKRTSVFKDSVTGASPWCGRNCREGVSRAFQGVQKGKSEWRWGDCQQKSYFSFGSALVFVLLG